MSAPCDHMDGTEWVDGIAYCLECGEPVGRDDDYDPTPWCIGCGARKQTDCHCGPLAANE